MEKKEIKTINFLRFGKGLITKTANVCNVENGFPVTCTTYNRCIS